MALKLSSSSRSPDVKFALCSEEPLNPTKQGSSGSVIFGETVGFVRFDLGKVQERPHARLQQAESFSDIRGILQSKSVALLFGPEK